MPFWHTSAKPIRNHFKRRFDPLEARADEGDRMPWNQTSPWANVPPDILYGICDQAFSETSAYYGVELLALVCIHWYQIVTSYGRPWSVIRIAPHLCESTVYTTLESYVNTRLKHSHHYPLDVIIHPVDRLGTLKPLQEDMKNAIDAVIGGGRHTRRWGTLSAIVHPYLRPRLKYATPILHRVDLVFVNQYETDLTLIFPVAPKLQVFSLTGRTESDYYYLRLPAFTPVTLENLQLVGFRFYDCISILERFSEKSQRLTTLELTGTWNYKPGRPPITLRTMLRTVRSLILNARGPICVMFSAIILPTLVELIVIGSQEAHERKNVLDDRDAFKSVGSQLETLRLESLHFDNEDHLESILLAAPKVKRLTMKGITYKSYKVPVLEDPTSEDPTCTFRSVGGWITAWEAPGEPSEPDYVTLLKGPLVFPVLEECIVEDITREDLVLLRRQREVE